MASQLIFSCPCGFSLDAWSDGNPYIIELEKIQFGSATSSNRKEYVYHPDSKVNEALGNDVPSICLAYCHLFESDTLDPRTCCMKCKSEKIIPCFDLAGKVCPKCGDLPLQVEGGAIS